MQVRKVLIFVASSFDRLEAHHVVYYTAKMNLFQQLLQIVILVAY